MLRQLPSGYTTEIKLIGDEYDSTNKDQYKPTFIFEYGDAPPFINNFNVKPAVDLLEKDVNLYELTTENLNAVKFNWSIGDDDIWYKMIHIDKDGYIENKYQHAKLWIPCNEEPPNLTTAPAINWYNKIDNTSGTATVGANVRSFIDGIQGYSPQISGNAGGTASIRVPYRTQKTITGITKANPAVVTATSHGFSNGDEVDISGVVGMTQVNGNTYTVANKTANTFELSGIDSTGYSTYTSGGIVYLNNSNSAFNGLSEFTFVVHVTFDASEKGSNTIILGQGLPGAGVLLKKNANDCIIFEHDHGVGPDSCTGSKVVNCDGKTPYAIAVTYKYQSEAGPDVQLFVDGTLDAYITDAQSAPDTTDHFELGWYIATLPTGWNYFQGRIEEFVLWDKHFIVTDNDEYIYNTADLTDLTSSKTNTWSARMFAYDYHNIRGSTYKEVASSKNISWRTTPV